jgi:hypothetical protein
MFILKELKVTWTFSYAYFEGMELLGHSPIRILKKRRFTWTFSYAYFEGMESYLAECPSNYPFLQNTYRRMSK